jgi:hypothetical protein
MKKLFAITICAAVVCPTVPLQAIAEVQPDSVRTEFTALNNLPDLARPLKQSPGGLAVQSAVFLSAAETTILQEKQDNARFLLQQKAGHCVRSGPGCEVHIHTGETNSTPTSSGGRPSCYFFCDFSWGALLADTIVIGVLIWAIAAGLKK